MNHVRTDRVTVTSWALWDWGSAAFNAVLVTFIFSVYLTDSVGQTLDTSATPTQLYGWVMAVAGVTIAVVAPIIGQRSDIRGTRRRSLAVWTFVTVALMAALFAVRNDAPVYFWLGAIIMAVASVLFEFAEVNYYAQLNQISTPDNVGRVSGFGWGMGYVGGIVLLVILLLLVVTGCIVAAFFMFARDIVGPMDGMVDATKKIAAVPKSPITARAPTHRAVKIIKVNRFRLVTSLSSVDAPKKINAILTNSDGCTVIKPRSIQFLEPYSVNPSAIFTAKSARAMTHISQRVFLARLRLRKNQPRVMKTARPITAATICFSRAEGDDEAVHANPRVTRKNAMISTSKPVRSNNLIRK